jgi:uncharacterized protein involved in response to NO
MDHLAQIEEPQTPEKFSIFSYGFRPFFLAAGIYTILPIIPWMLYLSGLYEPHISLQSWHAHEMLFGFVAAGISGFLLTAIPNWTNTPPLKGAGLRRFVYFWLLGRIAFWLFLAFDHPVFGALLFLDLLLPVSQGIRIARIFWKSGSKRNFIFVGVMAGLAAANLLVILDLSGITIGTAAIGAVFAPNIIMVTIAVIGGRVTPSFTRAYLDKRGIKASIRIFPLLEILAIGVLVLNAVLDLITPQSTLAYSVALIACVLHALRLSQWACMKTLGNPMVWVLHLGYLWLVVALFLKGAEGWLGLPYHLYVHAFTIGAVGIYLLGIMSRAALGHTGRKLQASKPIALAYLLVFAAALIRVVTPFYPDIFVQGMGLTTALWVLAFSLFLWVYAPILTSPRIDGKPG